MSEAFLKRSVKKYYRDLGYTVSMRRIRLGNTEVDGEALGPDGTRVAIEVKTAKDDLCRGLGQLSEATAFGYSGAVLVTTLRASRKIDLAVFRHHGWSLIGVDSKGTIHFIAEP